MRVAITGIPASQMRNVCGYSQDLRTLYREVTPRLHSEDNIRHEVSRIANTGNYLIGEGARYALIGNDVQFIPMPWLSGPNARMWLDHINQSFDYLVLCTANIFHRRHAPTAEQAVIAKVDIPILMMSAGIQNRSDFGETMPEAFKSFVALLAERKVTVFTRGTRTAEFLGRHKVAAEPVGCPSAFAFPDHVRTAMQRLKHVAVDGDGDILYSGYLGSVRDTIDDVNALSGPATRPRYVAQDEVLLFDYKVANANGAKVYNDASGEITAPVRFPGIEDLKVKLSQAIFFSTEQWRSAASQYDLAVARRFHGGLIAAQASVPTFWISVDDRTSEMLDFLALPHVEAEVWNKSGDRRAALKRFLAGYDPTAAVATYEKRLHRFRTLLSGLGLRAAA
jgi:hypothetical protein